MLAKVINYGRPQYFPTCIGNIWLERGVERDITNRKAAEELGAFAMVDMKIIEPDKTANRKAKAALRKTYEKYTRNQLRRLASQRGIKLKVTAKKVNIIKKLLEEKNGL